MWCTLKNNMNKDATWVMQLAQHVFYAIFHIKKKQLQLFLIIKLQIPCSRSKLWKNYDVTVAWQTNVYELIDIKISAYQLLVNINYMCKTAYCFVLSKRIFFTIYVYDARVTEQLTSLYWSFMSIAFAIMYNISINFAILRNNENPYDNSSLFWR